MNSNMNVAIIGLGRVGNTFLEKLINYEGNGVSIVAVSEKDADAPGMKVAKERGIKVCDDQQILDMGENIDIIFELTGNSEARRNLRMSMVTSKNGHTVIAPETVALFVWNLISKEGVLPDAHTIKGY